MRMEMMNLAFVLQSLKGRCYGDQFKYASEGDLTLGFATRHASSN